MPPGRSPLGDLFAALEAVFRRLDCRWYLFGAQAALLYGAARLTADVDVTVEAGDAEIRQLLDELGQAGFTPRVTDADQFIARTRVLPVSHTATSIPVDIIFAGPGLEVTFLDRAESHEIEGVRVPVACAEDLVTMKVLAGRPKDVEDAVAIVAAASERIDATKIRDTLMLLEEALSQSDLLPRLDAILARARGG